MRLVVVLLLCRTTSGEHSDPFSFHTPSLWTFTFGETKLIAVISRLLDKIAKEIMVCEHKTIKRWEGSIGEYKSYLRKKMITQGQV